MQAHTRECMCSKKKEKKKKSPVRWSGLISEITTARRSFTVYFSLFFLLYCGINAYMPPPFFFPPSPLPLFYPLHRPRGNLQALLTFAIIVSAARHRIFIFSFEIPRARSIIAVARKYRNAAAVVSSTRGISHSLASRYALLRQTLSDSLSIPFCSPLSPASTFSFNPRHRPHGIPRDFELCYSFSHPFRLFLLVVESRHYFLAVR